MNKNLMKRAVVLYPRTDYLDPSAVRHNRRQYLQAVNFLRSAAGGSKWILDQRVTRQ